MFKEKGILPSSTYNMGKGERIIANAFLREEIEQRNKESEMMNKMLGG
ncbi:hypothetical protein [Peptostreptococcus sp. D1]|nr:hypothetical protein [Peptostreptococcus sp. D1]